MSVSRCTEPNTHAVTDSATAQPMPSESATNTMGRGERKASQTSSSTAASEPQPMVLISRWACTAAASACKGMPARSRSSVASGEVCARACRAASSALAKVAPKAAWPSSVKAEPRMS
jgi:hypothetical protein